jgi:hypothetical protein
MELPRGKRLFDGFKEVASKFRREIEFIPLVDKKRGLVMGVRFKDSKQKLMVVPTINITRSEIDDDFFEEGLAYFEEVIKSKLN